MIMSMTSTGRQLTAWKPWHRPAIELQNLGSWHQDLAEFSQMIASMFLYDLIYAAAKREHLLETCT
jgi:hypothetical protein